LNYLLFKLLNIPTDHPGRIVRAGIGLHGETSLGWLIVLAVLLAAGVFYLYRHGTQDVSRPRRLLMATLRALFLALVLGLFAGPILTLTYADAVRQTLVLLLDTSDSMSLKDLRVEPADKARAALAGGLIDPARGLAQHVASLPPALERPARSAVLMAALQNPKLALLQRLGADYNLVPLAFDRELRPLIIEGPGATTNPAAQTPAPQSAGTPGWVAHLADRAPGTATATALGDAIRDTIFHQRGQLLAGIMLATDGGGNFGSNPLDAARLAKAENVPLYIYGVGISNPRDIIVSNIFVQQVAFVRDEVPLTVHVRSQGLKGQSGQLILKLGGQKMDEKTIPLGDNEEVEVPLKFTPDKIGDFDLTASIEPRPDEVSAANNTATRHIRVVDGRIKVLQIEQQPRFEFKFLQVQLLRDRRVEYSCLLLDGDPAIAQGAGTPYLAQFPATLDELARYDLVIYGDVDPHSLPDHALANLNQFVARFGGSLIVMAGHRFTPAAYHRTPLEEMLPVEFGVPEATGIFNTPNDHPLHLELTDKGKESPILRLAEKREENLARWAKAPPLYWDFRVLRPKSLAEVLMVDADVTKSSRVGKMPVLAIQGYGVGQVLWIGTDELWRFRKNDFADAYLTFWGQTIQRLSLAHMLGASKRTQLHANNEEYATGDRIAIQARLYNGQLAPLTQPTVNGFFSRKGGASETPRSVVLRQLPSQEGLYRAEFVAPEPGAYRFHVATDPETFLDFTVVEPHLEQSQTALNESALRSLAATSGGAFLREEDLYKLPEQIQHTLQPVYSTADAELAFSPLYFLVLVALITTEWILRKLVQLR